MSDNSRGLAQRFIENVRIGFALMFVTVAFVTWQLAVIIYNIYFHPLRHFPGPKLWIASCLVRHYYAIIGSFDDKIREFHLQYGEVVRFSPYELSFRTAAAWKDIYGHNRVQMPKGLFYSPDETPNISFSNDADHSRYRKSMANAFSEKSLRQQESLIKQYIDEMIHKLRDVATSQTPADMVKWYNLVGFDLIGDLAFGKSFGGLRDITYHEWVANIFEFAKVGQVVNMCRDYPWLLHIFRIVMKLSSGNDAKQRQSDHARAVSLERIHNDNLHGRGDFMDSLLQTGKNKDLLSEDEVISNANILLIAGAETTSTALSGTTFWLLKTPVALARVTQEVRSTFTAEEDIHFISTSTKLPYLNACLEEGMRRYPPISGILPRWTLSSTNISGYMVPPKSLVAVHQSAANWSDTNFHRPLDFCPERWLPESTRNPQSPFYGDNRDAMQAFSIGPRNCIGRNLAYNEMRVILARVLWNFDLTLSPESSSWDKQKAFSFWEKGPLMVQLQLRDEE
ncbi:hypothetical protein COCCADRAFT_10212 [Bipolaris zeicola 26-R-13]|uniref:Cytochrome P450 monooxygenase n=1 Tax=Cochliobolus carbonum (strain 26-R-13) TaxID=930089 RepID=W6XPA3_COCC2|nr:uncharacterized protein COCCADRAFT_10212 [Bipolaris zeicola 26-R-13]EUC27100.1 hypothetical protein COCCADRAFT_10212 [Bipolaris zeicola 26-R-13]